MKNKNGTEIYVERAIKKADEIGIPVCIAVCCPFGFLLNFFRLGDAPPMSVDLAIRKARTSAITRMSTHDSHKLYMKEKLYGLEGSNHGLVILPGGEPITENGKVLFAIGISGGTAAQDREIALYALNIKN